MQHTKDKMKRLLQVKRTSAAVLACLVLAGCGAKPETESSAPTTEAVISSQALPVTTEAPAPVRPTGLAEVSGLEPQADEMICAVAPDGAGAAVLLQRWDQAAQVSRYRVCFPDPETAAVTASVELAVPADLDLIDALPGLSGLDTTPTELRLLDAYNERCAVFDRTGRFLELRDWPSMDQAHLGWRNSLLNSDAFWMGDSLAWHIGRETEPLEAALGFYDQTDRLHLLTGEHFDDFPACRGHRVLAVAHQTEEEARVFSLLDFDEGLVLDQLVLPDRDETGRWQNPCGQVLGEDWVLLALSESGEEGEIPGLRFWYPAEDRGEPLADRVLSSEELTRELEALTTELEAKGLHVLLDQMPPPELTPTTGLSTPESACETGCSLFGSYLILTQLKAFTEKLPEGFLRELYTDLPGEESPAWETLNIYIVRNIPGDAAGFASSWTENLMICFATEEFDPSHLAHEFMHIMDTRLEYWLWSQDRNLEEEWWALSPDFAYDTELTPEQEEAVTDCFVSLYARTNSGEDRAETFQFLFDREMPLEDCWWYREKPGVQKKVRVLTELIREAFPSVQKAEKVWWE